MNKDEFKKGLRVKVIKKRDSCPVGLTGTILKLKNNSSGYDVSVILDEKQGFGHDCSSSELCEYGYGYNFEYGDLEIITSKGRAKRVKPVVKHIILKDSCDNFETKTNNFKEAKDYLDKKLIREAYTIYELVPVARVSPSIKIEKLNIKAKPKRGKKK